MTQAGRGGSGVQAGSSTAEKAVFAELIDARGQQGAPGMQDQDDSDAASDATLADRLSAIGIDITSLAGKSDQELHQLASRLMSHELRVKTLSKFFAQNGDGSFDLTTDPDGNPTGLDASGKPAPDDALAGAGDDAGGSGLGDAGDQDQDADAGAAPSAPAAPAGPAGPTPGAMGGLGGPPPGLPPIGLAPGGPPPALPGAHGKPTTSGMVKLARGG